jgi:hypothetical protein
MEVHNNQKQFFCQEKELNKYGGNSRQLKTIEPQRTQGPQRKGTT